MNRGDPSAVATEYMQAIEAAILDGDGDLDPTARQALFDRAVSHAQAISPAPPPLPDALEQLADLVATQAYRIGDSDIARLRAAGFSEDAILEAILCAAVGAGAGRLALGLAALHARR